MPLVALAALLLCTASAVPESGEGLAWLAGVLLQHEDELQLTSEQRVRLENIQARAHAAWRELSSRLAALESSSSEAERADWKSVAQERGRLRILADRDALLVLRRDQRERWRMLRRGLPGTLPPY